LLGCDEGDEDEDAFMGCFRHRRRNTI